MPMRHALLLLLGMALIIFSVSSASASPMNCLVEHEMAHAGGWPGNHPGAILKPGCGQLPMPPRAFPITGKKPIIRYVASYEMIKYCHGVAQACTYYGTPAVIYLPTDTSYFDQNAADRKSVKSRLERGETPQRRDPPPTIQQQPQRKPPPRTKERP